MIGLLSEGVNQLEQTGHGAAFQVDHYMAGLGATMTAAASLLGALAALGISRKKSAEKASAATQQGIDDALVEAYERGVEKGAELARQHA